MQHNPMPSLIIEAEKRLDKALPATRLEYSPPPALLDAALDWSQTIWLAAERLGPMPLAGEQIKQGLVLADNAVFICGVHRSGTTLVKDILDGHPELVVLPSEGTYLTNLEFKLKRLPENEWAVFLGQEWLRRMANPINQPPYWLLGRSTENSSLYVDFARYFMAWFGLVSRQNSQWPHTAIVLAYASCTNKLDAKLWVDKTPTNEQFLKRIWQDMPNAKILHVVREPVAALTSRKKMEPFLDIRKALSDMKTSFKIALAQHEQNNGSFLLLRYEQVCDAPAPFARLLTAFLNIIESASLNTPTVAGKPSIANSSFKSKQIEGQILKPRENNEQSKLTRNEQRLLAAYVGEPAARLGYPLLKVTTLQKIYLLAQSQLL